MAKQYCYMIISSDGISYDLWASWADYNQLDEVDDDRDDEELTWGSRKTLPQMLAAGWRPVRETPMGGAGKDEGAYALVLLEKEG
jgi:hypothetical protein